MLPRPRRHGDSDSQMYVIQVNSDGGEIVLGLEGDYFFTQVQIGLDRFLLS